MLATYYRLHLRCRLGGRGREGRQRTSRLFALVAVAREKGGDVLAVWVSGLLEPPRESKRERQQPTMSRVVARGRRRRRTKRGARRDVVDGTRDGTDEAADAARQAGQHVVPDPGGGRRGRGRAARRGGGRCGGGGGGGGRGGGGGSGGATEEMGEHGGRGGGARARRERRVWRRGRRGGAHVGRGAPRGQCEMGLCPSAMCETLGSRGRTLGLLAPHQSRDGATATADGAVVRAATGCLALRVSFAAIIPATMAAPPPPPPPPPQRSLSSVASSCCASEAAIKCDMSRGPRVVGTLPPAPGTVRGGAPAEAACCSRYRRRSARVRAGMPSSAEAATGGDVDAGAAAASAVCTCGS